MATVADDPACTPPHKPVGGQFRVLCEGIWRVEKETDLLNRTVAGLHHWLLVRLPILTAMATKQHLFSYKNVRSSRGTLLRLHLSATLADLAARTMKRHRRPDATLVVRDRRDMRGDALLPVHAACVEADPEIDHLAVIFRPTRDRQALASSPCEGQCLTFADNIASVLGRLRSTRFLEVMQREKATLDLEFRRHLGADLPLDARALAAAASVLVEKRQMMRRVLGRLAVKRLFVQVGHFMQSAIAAARDLGMEVCELLHSLITPYQLGYSYPGRPILPYPPDRLLLFGPYWQTAADLPGNTTSIVTGCRFLARYLAAPVVKVPRRVIVISQGVIGTRLFDAVASIAGRAPDWQFVFRCHPGEDVAEYNSRLAASAQTVRNFTISPQTDDFSELLASSDVQIGVFSTGLFEGIRLGTRTIVLNLPDIEYMQDIIDRGEAVDRPHFGDAGIELRQKQ